MKQRGFTLIELVTVIALLGILAAIALPRFIDVTDEAEDAVFVATRGSLTTSIALVRAAWVAKGNNPSTLTIDGITFNYSAEGWPKGTGTGNASCIQLWKDLMHNAPSIRPLPPLAGNADWAVFASGPTLCRFMYTPGDGLPSLAYNIEYYASTSGSIPAGTLITNNYNP